VSENGDREFLMIPGPAGVDDEVLEALVTDVTLPVDGGRLNLF
jgi:aspartate aminotransferase-like enzyme